MLKLKDTFREYMRVLQVARKPTREEFLLSSKVSAIGIFLIGIIGFSIFLLFLLAGI